MALLRPTLFILLSALSQRKILANVAFTPCAAKNSLVPFYFDQSVQTQTTQVNAPLEPCPSCINAFYFAPTKFANPFNGASILSPDPFFDPANGFARILTCPNWCACTADGFCASNLDSTYAALYPYCSSPTRCGMLIFPVNTGQTPTHFYTTPGNTEITVAVMFPPGHVGVSFAQAPSDRIFTSASCNGCSYAITCNKAIPALCFSADTSFYFHNRSFGRMDQLQIGDLVLEGLTPNSVEHNGDRSMEKQQQQAPSLLWGQAVVWLHREPHTLAEFHRIELANGRVLKLTAKHYVYSVRRGEAGCPTAGVGNFHCINFHYGYSYGENYGYGYGHVYGIGDAKERECPKNRSIRFLHSFDSYDPQPTKLIASSEVTITKRWLVYADEIRPGDCLFGLAANMVTAGYAPVPVLRVSRIVERGIYAPLTSAGTIIADGVLASCYTLVHSPALYADIIMMVREWWVMDLLLGMAGFRGSGIVEVPDIVRWMLDLAMYVLPEYSMSK